MDSDCAHSQDELEGMLDAIRPAWRLRDAESSDAGYHFVYRLTVETPDGERDCYLKATPEGRDPTVDLEARLLTVLEANSAIPVPIVLGVVDESAGFSSPFVLTEAGHGETASRTELASMSVATLWEIARTTGRQLAELHTLNAVGSFGFLSYEGSVLRGERPSGDLDSIAAADPIDSWYEQLETWGSETIESLGETRFADVAPEARSAFEARIDDLDGPFRPVLARIDQSLENVLVDDGELTTLLDWEFTIAATPAYDVVCVVWSLAGGPYLYASEVPDRREFVREAVLAGYREQGPDRVIRQVRTNGACYELLSSLRSMTLLTQWYRSFGFDQRVDGAAEALRAEVEKSR